jgi:ubiquinone/menaquinone biosynthesis C-methylase UbiE
MDLGKYLMESDDETLRLDMKTDGNTVEKQALWAGITPGMRVADLGFGSGKTTSHLHKLVQPGGMAVGVDYSSERISFARNQYKAGNLEFIQRDIREPLDDLGEFDFIWVRFVLEYHKSTSFEIVQSISRILKPGGILALIDLDHNCLSHFGLSKRLEKTLIEIVTTLELHADFDPYAGRKLYSYLYDLGYLEIDVDMSPHHLIFGELGGIDAFNWDKKAEVAVKQSGFEFDAYQGGYEEFYEEFTRFFKDPRRFTYTPLILCRGVKPGT